MKSITQKLFATLMLAGSSQLYAEPLETDDWQFEVTPYLWAADMESEMRLGEVTSVLNLDFEEIVDVLHTGFMGQFEASKGQWSVYSDLVYLNLNDDTNPIANVELEADLKQFFGIVAIGYKPAGMDVLDLYIGVRHDAIDVSLDVTGALTERNAGDKLDWTDPVVGARARFPINEEWLIEMQAFYSTGSADFTAVGSIGVRWEFGEHWSSSLSYRLSEIDYDDDAGFKQTTAGVMMGFSYRF